MMTEPRTKPRFTKWVRPPGPTARNYCDHYATTADDLRCERCQATRKLIPDYRAGGDLQELQETTLPICGTCGEPVEDAGAHADFAGHWPTKESAWRGSV